MFWFRRDCKENGRWKNDRSISKVDEKIEELNTIWWQNLRVSVSSSQREKKKFQRKSRKRGRKKKTRINECQGEASGKGVSETFPKERMKTNPLISEKCSLWRKVRTSAFLSTLYNFVRLYKVV